jgi:hypothetical protein
VTTSDPHRSSGTSNAAFGRLPFNFGQGLLVSVPIEHRTGETSRMDRRAVILPELRAPSAATMLNERTIERLYGLSTMHPAEERHDVTLVAAALQRLGDRTDRPAD